LCSRRINVTGDLFDLASMTNNARDVYDFGTDGAANDLEIMRTRDTQDQDQEMDNLTPILSSPDSSKPLQSYGQVQDAAAGPVTYRVYKRRFFGLAQLVLLNVVVSWDVC
jgi:hypothetical protein